MSCDWCEAPVQQQQQRGRPRQRTIQGRRRRHGTTSPPKFSTNSAKFGCTICAPYYSNKVSKRSVLNSEVRDYNKSFAGKPASAAVHELCGDWYQSPAGSVYSSAYSTQHDAALEDDFGDHWHCSAAVRDGSTRLQELYDEQNTVSPMQSSGVGGGNPAAELGQQTARISMGMAEEGAQHSYTFPSTQQVELVLPYAAPQLADFAFPCHPTAGVPARNPLASVHLWPSTADSVLAHDPSASVFSRPGHVYDTLASYSQMFSASWMPQAVPGPAPVPEMTQLGAEQLQGNHEGEGDVVDEDFEHLSQMSEQDWFDTQQVDEDDYVLV